MEVAWCFPGGGNGKYMKKQAAVMPGRASAALSRPRAPVQWEATTGILETSVILDQVGPLVKGPHSCTLGSSVSCSSTSHSSGEVSVYYVLGRVLAASPRMPNFSCPHGEQEAGCNLHQSIFLSFSLPHPSAALKWMSPNYRHGSSSFRSPYCLPGSIAGRCGLSWAS